MAATRLTMQRWASDLVINPLTSLCSYISAPPTYLAPTVSCAANMHNTEGSSADMTNTSVCGDDVLDCDVAHQSQVSAHLSSSLAITCESLGPVVSHHIDARTFLLQVFVIVFVSWSWQGQNSTIIHRFHDHPPLVPQISHCHQRQLHTSISASLVVVDRPWNTRALLGPFRVNCSNGGSTAYGADNGRAECTSTVDGKRGGAVVSAGLGGAIGTNYW